MNDREPGKERRAPFRYDKEQIMPDKTVEYLNGKKHLWLPDLRKIFNGSAGRARCVIRLVALTGDPVDYVCDLPYWNSSEERDFVLRYLAANVFNILCGNGGRRMCIFYDLQNSDLSSLIAELPAVFRLEQKTRHGYGKVINIANRILRLHEEPGFSFESRDISEYDPAGITAEPVRTGLDEALRKRITRSSTRNCVGVDIGGTDIKLAASAGDKLICIKEFDWNPAASPTAEGIYGPILLLIRLMRACIAAELSGAGGESAHLLAGALDKGAPVDVIGRAVAEAEKNLSSAIDVLDAVGISFPDVVIRDRIVGGETPKTSGIRENTAVDYETEFVKLAELRDMVLRLCRKGGTCHITNDGNMAAFTAATESVAAGDIEPVKDGIVAFSIGTSLGTGWVLPSGEIPQIPLEMYELLLDLGPGSETRYLQPDLRSILSESSGLPAISGYLGQAPAFRMAYEFDKSILEGYIREENGVVTVITEPEDLRKPCLEHLMRLAETGKKEAEDIFRCTGYYLAQVVREMGHIFRIDSRYRYLFGRFAKSKHCFELIREGFDSAGTGIVLKAADSELAATPLMRQLAVSGKASVAQFAQAIGSIYFAV
jgi:hypothetical protein